MKKIKFDDGVQQFQVGEGVLRFNPRDPGLYDRFLVAVGQMEAITAQGGTAAELDTALRAELETLLPGTDWQGVLPQNLLALGGNGKPLVLNFLEALEEILLDGARAYAREN